MTRKLGTITALLLIAALAFPLLSSAPVLAAAPSVLSVTERTFTSSGTTHDVQMPATIDADDLLIVLFVNTNTATVTTPANWTLLKTGSVDSGSADGNGVRFSVYYKKAVGNEDGAYVDFVTSSSQRAAAQIYRISASSWHGTTPPECSDAVTGTSNNGPNPASLNPAGWGTEDTLWIAACGFGDDDGVDTYPTSYSSGVDTIVTGSGDDCTVGSARRANTVASEDPGTFNINGSDNEDWVAFTIAVRPAPTCTNYWHDVDGDDYGGGDPECLNSTPLYQYATVGGDCNDTNLNINPGMTEVTCNTIDDDCNPATEDNPADNDGDGYGICDGDCDDNDATVYPDALEVCDGIDNDCDGDIDSDDSDFIPLKAQVAMILDGSGSIDSTEWNIMVTGLAQAVSDTDCVPHDGSVELTVIVFASSATVGLGPLVITDANAADVVYDITNLSRSGIGSSTCISCGLCLAADTLAASPCFDASLKQAINLVTDGDPNYCSCSGGTCGDSGSSCNLASAQASAVCAREYLLATLNMTEPQDEFDAEGIGITDANRDWLKNNIIFPATGYSSPPGSWPPPSPGWVRVFATFEEFVPSLCEKFHTILEEQCILNVTSDGCCPIIVGTMGTVGAGTTGNFTVPCGTNVTLVADYCNPCCVFDYWSGNASGTNPTVEVTVSGNMTVTGTCHWLTYNLTVESDGCCPITVGSLGSVDAGESETFEDIPCGTNVTLTANNSTCCAFDSWEATAAFPVPGAIAIDGGENIIVITMDSNYTAVAHCHWSCASIGDTIFYDNNDNGTQDPGEAGIGNVMVDLYEDDVVYGVFDPEWMGGSTDDLVATTETDVDGVYLFPDLAPGCYWVWVNETTLPPGVNLTTGDNPLYYCVAEGEAYEGADFGYLGATLPVGGTAYPINKLIILLPWIALAAIIAGATMLMRRRKAQS